MRCVRQSSLKLCILLACAAGNVDAQSPVAADVTDPRLASVQLPSVVVEAEAESDHVVQGPFLPDVQGVKINAGKKTTIIDLDALPKIHASNYRLALIQTPSLLLSEESTPLLSIGYRGLEPHRAQYTQVLKDGIPIHADQFGYPEAYYVPPLETVDRIEFVRGGGALMYGPQPGGALNYVTHRPRTDRAFGGATTHIFGADSAWSSFTYIDGTRDRLGYYAYYNHRETDGTRRANSDVDLDAGQVKLALDAEGPTRWFATLESYREAHGEPGGLTLTSGPNDVNYNLDRDASSRQFDRFELDRDAATLTFEQDLDAGQFSARAWAVDYTRHSRRQRGGGFGSVPVGANAATNDIETQQFDSFGIEGRYSRDWGREAQHTLAAGAQFFTSDSPRTDARGASADARSGMLRIASQRDLDYTSVFAENLFRFGRFSLTPGVRIESFEQSVETQFINPAGATRRRSDANTVALFGLGATWDIGDDSRIYFNASESYRPVIFTEAVPNSTTTVVAGDLEEGTSWQADLGYRMQSANGLVLDTSLFHMQFLDKIGGAGTASDPIRNIGKIEYRGFEASAQYDLFRLGNGDRTRQLNALLNVTLLDAEITRDAVAARRGNTPQYAPDYFVRVGLVYGHGEDRKLGLFGTFVDDSFADDSSSANRLMPAYQVWDLTADWRIGRSRWVLLGGIYNLFDENYYSRIRNDGIDPAPGRNAYIGFRAEF